MASFPAKRPAVDASLECVDQHEQFLSTLKGREERRKMREKNLSQIEKTDFNLYQDEFVSFASDFGIVVPENLHPLSRPVFRAITALYDGDFMAARLILYDSKTYNEHPDMNPLRELLFAKGLANCSHDFTHFMLEDYLYSEDLCESGVDVDYSWYDHMDDWIL